MLALIVMFGSAIIFLAGGLYLSIAMGQDAVANAIDTAAPSEPRFS